MRVRGSRLAVMTLAGALLAAAPLLAIGGTAQAADSTAHAAARPPAQVRVNQVAYPAVGPKVAYAMLPAAVASVAFTVSDGTAVVYRGRSATDVGGWNSRYHAVYALNFAAVTRPGTAYRIKISAAGQTAQSPPFAVGNAQAAYGRLVTNAVRYFTSERDGPDVQNSVLNREPANLTDEHAYVYATPQYDSNDNLLGTFHKIGGPVNVAGGWFDAGGGYEKFAYTATYADGLMEIAQRDFPRQYPTLGPEASFGLRWLEKLWNPKQKALYIQVGIGNGNASNTIQGDYNFWFLPQAEDQLDVTKGGNPGPSAYYVKYRPVFAAASPGKPVSPELAGRFAANFGLAAQLTARQRRPAAERLLSLARGVYAMAQTTHVTSIVTTFPYDYYGGTEWKSDMLWGAAEIALADEALGAPASQVHADLLVASRWARAYIAQGHPATGDTLNLYDNGAIGEGELLRGHAPGARRLACDNIRRERGRRPSPPADRPRRAASPRGEPGEGRPVRARRAAGQYRRLAACVRSLHHQRPVPAVRRRRAVHRVRPAAAELRARRERLGQLVRGRCGHDVSALHAERDRQPGRIADRYRQYPARSCHRRPEQPVLVRRPWHGQRHACVQRW